MGTHLDVGTGPGPNVSATGEPDFCQIYPPVKFDSQLERRCWAFAVAIGSGCTGEQSEDQQSNAADTRNYDQTHPGRKEDLVL